MTRPLSFGFVGAIVLGFLGAAGVVVMQSHRFRHGAATTTCAAHLAQLHRLANLRMSQFG